MNSCETINLFLSEMLTWETNYRRVIRSQDYKTGSQEFRSSATSENRIVLKSILMQYLTLDAISTIGQANLDTMAVGNPPSYEQTVEGFEEKGHAGKVNAAQANAGGFSRFCLYNLSRENELWKIESVFRSSDQIKWTKAKSI